MSRRTPSYRKPEALKHALRLALDEKYARELDPPRVHKTKWKQRAHERLDEHVNWHDWVDEHGRFTIPKTKG